MQPSASPGLFTHPGGVLGGPFPFEWVTPLPGSGPDGWYWPVESLGPFVGVPDDAPEVPARLRRRLGAAWLGDEPEEEPVGALVGEELVVVVDGSGPEPVGEVAVVVVVPAVVVVEPSPGAEAGGAEVVPTGEAGAPASGGLGALTTAGFTEEDGGASEDGATVLAATIGGTAAGAGAPTPGCAPGWVAPASGLVRPDAGG